MAAIQTEWLEASSEDEIEFLKAMAEYKRANRRPFPTWSEVLGVLRTLGYGKKEQLTRTGDPQADLRLLCSTLLEERDQQQVTIAELRRENSYLKSNLGNLMFEDIEIDKEKMLLEASKEPSILELIAEVERAGAAHGSK
jgi:hypothetical protein